MNTMEMTEVNKEKEKEIEITKRESVRNLLERKFWEEANWFEIMCEVLFHIKRRETTIEREIYCGFVQFISCLYILPVLPIQLERAGYDLRSTYVVTVWILYQISSINYIYCLFIYCYIRH